MNRNTSIAAILWIGACLTGASASTFDGVTNTIPDGTAYTELEIGKDLPNTVINIDSNSTVSVTKFIRLGANDSSTNNMLQVQDGATVRIGTPASPGTNGIVIGDVVGDALIIKNGSTVESSRLTMGTSSEETAQVSVKGEGSTLQINQDVSIGALSNGNQVNVSDGATFSVLGQLNVGATNTEDNAINVDSSSTLSISSLQNLNIADNNDIVINGTLQAKGDVSTSLIGEKNLTMNSGSQILVDDTLIGDIEDGYAIVLNESATWDTLDSDARIGFSTEGNSLSIISNSTITITNVLTAGDESNQNALNLQEDAKLIADSINIGLSGSSNSLNIEDNAVLDMTNGTLTVGGNSSAAANTVALQDEGALTAAELTIGSGGKNNSFTQTGGMATILGNVTVGARDGSSGNSISMSGSNSVFTATQDLVVGDKGDSNSLKINGGILNVGQDLYLGNSSESTGNSITISGEAASLNVTNRLFVGSDTSSNNTVTVRNGGTLSVSTQTGIVMGSASNNTLTVKDGGTLKTGDWNFDDVTGTATNIVLESGSTLHLLGMLEGTNRIEEGRNFLLDGTNALWNSTSNLFVGYETDENSLVLTNGAEQIASSNLYVGYASSDNALTIGGSGSMLTVGNDLFIGTEEDESTFNSLFVRDGAMLEVSNNASLFRGAVLSIGSTARATVHGDYRQDSYSTLEIGISSNQVQPNLTIDGSAKFTTSADKEEYPMIRIYDEGIAESNVVTIVQAGGITVDGEKATSGLITANIATNLLLGFSVTVSNDADYAYIVLDDFIKRNLGETLGLSGQLLLVADEIESLSSSNATIMLGILDGMDATSARKALDGYYGEKMSSIPAHNAINIGLQSYAEQLTKRADNTRERMKAAATAYSTAPDGAMGPHMEDQALQGWITAYKNWADHSADSGFDGYDGSIGGFMIGADMAVENGILVGVAGGSGSSSLDMTSGGSTDTRTLFGSLYASMGSKDWFADASFIYGDSSVDARIGSAFDTEADYDAQNVAFYFGGGKEILTDYLIFTPEASVLANYYTQESYIEKSTTAVPRKVDSFDTLYFQSAVGGNVAFYTALGDTIIKPEFRAFWLHEFNAREENLSYSLIGGTGSYNLKMQAPESDMLKLGGGISAKLGEFLELRADLDTRVASSYSDYTLLGSIRYQF